jgi:hypothetical protein
MGKRGQHPKLCQDLITQLTRKSWILFPSSEWEFSKFGFLPLPSYTIMRVNLRAQLYSVCVCCVYMFECVCVWVCMCLSVSVYAVCFWVCIGERVTWGWGWGSRGCSDPHLYITIFSAEIFLQLSIRLLKVKVTYFYICFENNCCKKAVFYSLYIQVHSVICM